MKRHQGYYHASSRTFEEQKQNSPVTMFSAYLGKVQFDPGMLCGTDRDCACGGVGTGMGKGPETPFLCCGQTADSGFSVRAVDFDDYMDYFGLASMDEFQKSVSQPDKATVDVIFDPHGPLPCAKVDVGTNRVAYYLSLVAHATLLLHHLESRFASNGPPEGQNRTPGQDAIQFYAAVRELTQVAAMTRSFLEQRGLQDGALRSSLDERTASRSVALWCGAEASLLMGAGATRAADDPLPPSSASSSFLEEVVEFLSGTPGYSVGDEAFFLDPEPLLRAAEATRDLFLEGAEGEPSGDKREERESLSVPLLASPASAQDVYDEACNYNAAVDATFCCLEFLDFASRAYGVRSLAGRSHVLCVIGVPELDNAFYSPSGVMVFGEGHQHFTSLVSSDVVAHELAHGICKDTCGLQYRGESGALNESFSDILASAFEFHLYDKFKARVGTDFKGVADWEIGEDMARDFGRKRLRHMRHPALGMRPQPCRYQGQHWADPNNLKVDHGGVHVNSGVGNRLFFLLATAVFGDRVTLASMFAFEVYSQNLSPSSTFADYSRSLCAKLEEFLLRYGVCSRASAETHSKGLLACLAECGLDGFVEPERPKPPAQSPSPFPRGRHGPFPMPQQRRPRRAPMRRREVPSWPRQNHPGPAWPPRGGGRRPLPSGRGGRPGRPSRPPSQRRY